MALGIFDSFQSFERVEIINQDRNRLRPICAQKGGESQQRRWVREYDFKVVTGKELL